MTISNFEKMARRKEIRLEQWNHRSNKRPFEDFNKSYYLEWNIKCIRNCDEMKFLYIDETIKFVNVCFIELASEKNFCWILRLVLEMNYPWCQENIQIRDIDSSVYYVRCSFFIVVLLLYIEKFFKAERWLWRSDAVWSDWFVDFIVTAFLQLFC